MRELVDQSAGKAEGWYSIEARLGRLFGNRGGSLEVGHALIRDGDVDELAKPFTVDTASIHNRVLYRVVGKVQAEDDLPPEIQQRRLSLLDPFIGQPSRDSSVLVNYAVRRVAL